jgi:hypothetical protein
VIVSITSRTFLLLRSTCMNWATENESLCKPSRSL